MEEGGKLALTAKNGLSTDLDVLVYSSYDGVNFDSELYVSMNLGASKTKTIPVAASPRFFKIKVENKDAVNATNVTTKVTQLEGRD